MPRDQLIDTGRKKVENKLKKKVGKKDAEMTQKRL